MSNLNLLLFTISFKGVTNFATHDCRIHNTYSKTQPKTVKAATHHSAFVFLWLALKIWTPL